MIRKYKKLCENCDYILKKNSDNIILNAITFLHVLKAHPESLKNYSFF